MAHFYESLPADITALTDRQAMERFVAGAEAPRRAIAGLSSVLLNSVPVPGAWSIQQIVLHLMDTDLIAAYRMKRIIAEDRPKLELYDENAFAQHLYYERMDAKVACEIFRGNRLLMGRLLTALPDEAFLRTALHPEMGEMSLSRFVRLYVKHLEHHMSFVTRKLERLNV